MAISSTAALLEEALALHRGGAVAEAAARYSEVLQADPRSADAYYYLGLMSCQAGRFDEGAALARKALASDACHANAHALLGRALSALGQHEEAIESFQRAIAIAPGLAPAHSHLADILSDLGRKAEAIDSYDRALALAPGCVEDWFNRGLALHAAGRQEEALASFDRAIAGRGNFAQAHLERANVLWRLQRHEEALESVNRAVALDSGVAEAWHSRGNILHDLRQYDEALAAFDKALARKPDLAEALCSRGNTLRACEQYEDALLAYDKALAFKPDLAAAWLGRGNVFFQLKKHEEASAAFDKALNLEPDLAEAWLGRGALFSNLKKHDESLAAYDRALALKPDLAEAWLGRGRILLNLKKHDESLAAYDRALALKPDLTEAWLGRGAVFSNLKKYGEALAAYDCALALKPDSAQAWAGRATTALYMTQYGQAFLAYDKALTLEPDLDYVEGLRLAMKLHLCDWTELNAETTQFLTRVRKEMVGSVPFALLPLPSSAEDQLQCAQRYMKDLPAYPPVWLGQTYLHDRIRVAYLSADFRNHAVAYLTAGLFEHHDHSRFEITGISIGPAEDSLLRRRLEGAFEHFVDAEDKNESDIANLIKNREIDILVDLMGHTLDSRLGILARRPAPIQIHYLGYAGTTAASFIDYIVADPIVIPEQHRAFFTEEVIWLPGSYLVNDNQRRVAEQTPTRAACGLPENAFVYCSFNNAFKIAPSIFAIWLRLLRATSGSVLWLSELNATARANLRREAERCGINPQRLIFAPKVADNADHLARQRLADLFLDTLPYNAHTTASDALWAGLPVLTCLGETFAGRVAASLLRAIGLPELITTSLDEYEALALKLANDPALLATIKSKLAQNRETCPLFNTARFTRHIEAAYITMWERYQRGEPPAAFAVGEENCIEQSRTFPSNANAANAQA
jgi:protein O-GlcNAc transferase